MFFETFRRKPSGNQSCPVKPNQAAGTESCVVGREAGPENVRDRQGVQRPRD